jgi:hypothetical protein
MQRRAAFRRRGEVGALLLRACAYAPPGQWRGLDVEGWDDLERAALWHQVSGQLLRSYGRFLPRETETRLMHVNRAMVVRQLSAAADIAWLQRCLGPNCEWMLFKGPTLARYYQDPSVRRPGDLDVLLRPEDVRAALDHLRADGRATMVDRNWSLMRRAGVGQFHFVLPSGTPLDLHWHLLNHRRLRGQFTVRTQPIFGRAVEVVVDGTTVLTMHPVDALVHTALHAAVSGGNVLRWYCDIDRLVRAVPPDWDDVARRALEWSANMSVGPILWRSRALLETPVPEEAVRTLVPSSTWRGLVRVAQALSPVEETGGGSSMSRIVARAGRGTLRASTTELLARTVARAYNRSDGHALHEPLNAQGLAQPSGSPADLESLLREIEDAQTP